MQDFDFEQTRDEVEPDSRHARIVYYLYLGSVVLATLTLPAVVLAYVFRPGDGSWVDSHYRFQIRTFWMMLLHLLVAGLASLFVIGLLLFPLIIIWWLIRNARGLKHLSRHEAYPDETTWLW